MQNCPVARKVSKMDAPISILGALWSDFGVTLGANWAPRGIFFEVQNLMQKTVLKQTMGELREIGAGGGGPI